jgi:hypothetical protein
MKQNEAALVALYNHEGAAVSLVGEVAFRDTIASSVLADQTRKRRSNEITPGSNHIKFSTNDGAPLTGSQN